MIRNFGPFHPSVRMILHGGDYNPDQWRDYPEVLKEDLRLMDLANFNSVSVNIFGWSAIEPEEGRFTFDWLDKVIDDSGTRGAKVVLATPSGSKPAWMSQKYPEIRRVNRDGTRMAHGGRHNHCYSSPVFRKKVREMSERLALRYGKHPALVLWHINNEFNGGECHCEHCYAGFRRWVQSRYGSLERLNHAWWNHFWSHSYNDWSQVEPLDPENLGQELAWKRFISDNCIEYFKAEIEPLKRISPHVPVTTNMMGAYYGGLNYWKLAAAEDVASWDSYPSWHKGDDAWEASLTAFAHDVARSFKGGKPFLLMESTPEGTNWQEVGKTKRPGMHLASSLQAVAHGSDSIQYFQWRKGRGGFEQFHGAVVDHQGTEKTRVFREVSEVGRAAQALGGLVGTTVNAEAAFVWDCDTRWAIELARGPRNSHKDYERDTQEHYHEFWRRGIACAAVPLGGDLSPYKVLVAPYLYMLDEKFALAIEAFVKKGGTFVTTYLAGTVDEECLCHLGGRPGLLRKVLGIWAEETDVLHDYETQGVLGSKGNALGLKGRYAARHYADIVHLEGAKALASYGDGWYKGSPAVTVNSFGKGQAYYLASRNSQDFLSDFYAGVIKKAGLKSGFAGKIPDGVEVSERGDDNQRFLFFINYRNAPRSLSLGKLRGENLLDGKKAGPMLKLKAYGAAVLRVL